LSKRPKHCPIRGAVGRAICPRIPVESFQTIPTMHQAPRLKQQAPDTLTPAARFLEERRPSPALKQFPSKAQLFKCSELQHVQPEVKSR
uniref:Uncharacterized protein n=1 Tax=Maylandia zebra TaxID=106582 RepID=A0A3P9BN86_9CICH